MLPLQADPAAPADLDLASVAWATVGATIAAGNQEWNGIWADFVNAPSSTSTSATVTPSGGSATTARSW